MCLTNPKRIFPTEDIMCWKVFLHVQQQGTDPEGIDDTAKLKSVFFDYEYVPNKRIIACPFMYSDSDLLEENGHLYTVDDDNNVESGVFHSFASIEDLIEEFRPFLLSEENAVIYKCVIPKDSQLVFEGEFGGGKKCYGSSNIIIFDDEAYAWSVDRNKTLIDLGGNVGEVFV